MFIFLKRSIKAKVIGLIVFILIFSQLASFAVTYWNIGKSQERNLKDSFERTNQLFDTLVDNNKKILDTQVSLVGSLPILVAVLDSEDEDTVVDSLQAYKDELSLSFIDVFNSNGDFFTNLDGLKAGFPLETGKVIANMALNGEGASSFAIRNGHLSLVASSVVGSQVGPSGAVIFGKVIDDKFAREIKKLSNSDISFIINGKNKGSSLSTSDISKVVKLIDQGILSLESDFQDQDFLYKLLPIKNFKGKNIGQMVLQASLAESKAFFKRLIIFILILSFVVILLFLILGFKFSKNITSPVVALKDVATSIQKSLDYSMRTNVSGIDEVAKLSLSFNSLLDEIQKNHRSLKEYSRNLERKVEQRTYELKGANQRMDSLLNNLDQGFLVFDKSGVILPGSTKAVSTFFEIEPCGKELHQIFHISEEESIEEMRNWINLVFSDVLIDINSLLEVGPSKFINSQECFIGIDYKPVFADDDSQKLEKIICIASDKTQEEKFKQEAEQEKVRGKFVLTVLDDKRAFMDFVNECSTIIGELLAHVGGDSLDLDFLFRYMHTIKGGASSYHFLNVAELAHSLENKLADLKSSDEKELFGFREELFNSILKIQEKFESTLEDYKFVIGDMDSMDDKEVVISQEIAANIINRFKELNFKDEEFLDLLVNNFYRENIAVLFNRFTKVIKRISESQGKEIDFEIKESSIFVNTESYKGLLASLVHIFRNAVDHGIEDSMTREMVGKTPHGAIKVSFNEKDENLFIFITDDGQGIDSAKISRLIVEKEIESKDVVQKLGKDEIIQYIFHPGFSTKDVVSEISGRGVGLDSVLYEARKLGGFAVVKTVEGEGSEFVIKVPLIKNNDNNKTC